MFCMKIELSVERLPNFLHLEDLVFSPAAKGLARNV